MKTMSYEQAKYALIGYRWIKGWRIIANINERIGYYTLDVIGEENTIRAYAIVSKRTALKIKKEWDL